eukprot:1157653-Pelagomonas_calceolata.AAC.12
MVFRIFGNLNRAAFLRPAAASMAFFSFGQAQPRFKDRLDAGGSGMYMLSLNFLSELIAHLHSPGSRLAMTA